MYPGYIICVPFHNIKTPEFTLSDVSGNITHCFLGTTVSPLVRSQSLVPTQQMSVECYVNKRTNIICNVAWGKVALIYNGVILVILCVTGKPLQCC